MSYSFPVSADNKLLDLHSINVSARLLTTRLPRMSPTLPPTASALQDTPPSVSMESRQRNPPTHSPESRGELWPCYLTSVTSEKSTTASAQYMPLYQSTSVASLLCPHNLGGARLPEFRLVSLLGRLRPIWLVHLPINPRITHLL